MWKKTKIENNSKSTVNCCPSSLTACAARSKNRNVVSCCVVSYFPAAQRRGEDENEDAGNRQCHSGKKSNTMLLGNVDQEQENKPKQENRTTPRVFSTSIVSRRQVKRAARKRTRNSQSVTPGGVWVRGICDPHVSKSAATGKKKKLKVGCRRLWNERNKKE